MKKPFNFLMLPALLLVLWLLLNDTLSPGQIVFGGILALFLAWAARAMRPLRARPRHPLKALKLLGHVLIDVTHSNLMVARIIWLGRKANATPGFIHVPIRLKDPHALAVLACIVTFTPGTVWSDYSATQGILTLHVLDLKDEAHWIELIRTRYETPLQEIFE
ncbi:MAG: Na+/H+ antiporter subunit E [Alcaligenaceae bacterium]|nr:Na+/H+ antiporter subunit E [Alcaligenaceae bacterium]